MRENVYFEIINTRCGSSRRKQESSIDWRKFARKRLEWGKSFRKRELVRKATNRKYARSYISCTVRPIYDRANRQSLQTRSARIMPINTFFDESTRAARIRFVDERQSFLARNIFRNESSTHQPNGPTHHHRGTEFAHGRERERGQFALFAKYFFNIFITHTLYKINLILFRHRCVWVTTDLRTKIDYSLIYIL